MELPAIKGNKIPRLPLEGSIDLTYRCNNHCLHCWLWLPEGSKEQKNELTFDEIRRIVDEARAMGCRRWNISGGEPMLRADFPEIFDTITRKSIGYSLNTNGTLITPEIARLLTRKGTKMVALYGATAEVYDHITRNPGGFEKAMNGFRHLQDAGAGFIVQLIPMRDNWHQWDEMVALAGTLSPQWRVGAPWLYLSSDGSPRRNREIELQRLQPADVIELDQPAASSIEHLTDSGSSGGSWNVADDRLFYSCISGRNEFHIDAYGGMSWCSFIKDPALRYDLRQGSFQDAWENFIPSCAEKIRGGEEWRENCGSCDNREDCSWCAVYAYLETGRYSAPISYLCAVAEEGRRYKEKWQGNHRRYFQIAGITVCIESDLDFNQIKFDDALTAFSVDGAGDDNVILQHHFELPLIDDKMLGNELYRKLPWVISRNNEGWIYRCITKTKTGENIRRLGFFNADYTHASIYGKPFTGIHTRSRTWHSLSLFPSDQIWLGPLLADRQAVILHSGAAILNGQGFIFVGHADAGKSTTMEMLKDAIDEQGLQVEILCDDRNVIRKWPDGWRVHGTWSHGTISDVSSASAPLRAILFLHQDSSNWIETVQDRKQVWKRILATLIRPMVTAEWWQNELNIIERIVEEIPCYVMHFDKSGDIVTNLVEMDINQTGNSHLHID